MEPKIIKSKEFSGVDLHETNEKVISTLKYTFSLPKWIVEYSTKVHWFPFRSIVELFLKPSSRTGPPDDPFKRHSFDKIHWFSIVKLCSESSIHDGWSSFRVVTGPIFLNRYGPTGPVRPVEKPFQSGKKQQKSAGLLNYFHRLEAVVSKKCSFFFFLLNFLPFFEKEYHILVVSMCQLSEICLNDTALAQNTIYI